MDYSSWDTEVCTESSRPCSPPFLSTLHASSSVLTPLTCLHEKIWSSKKKAEERWVEGRCNQVYVTWRCTGAGTQLDCRPIQNNPTGCASSSLQPVGTLHCSGNSSGLTILYVDLLYVLNAWKHKPLMSQLTQVSTLGVLKSEVHK